MKDEAALPGRHATTPDHHPPETLPRRPACIPRLEVVVAIEGSPVVRIVAATAEDEEAMRAWVATVPLLAPLLEAA